MDQTDIASSNALGRSLNEAGASGNEENDKAEVEDHPGTRTPSQKTESPSELDLPFKQGSSHIPIHSLPTELLLEVILLDVFTYIDGLSEEYYFRLVGLSGICSGWYHVIRDSPYRWTRMHGLDSPEIYKLALERCMTGDLPLELDITTEPSQGEYFGVSSRVLFVMHYLTCKPDLPNLRTFTTMSTQIIQVDPPDSQDRRSSITNQLAKSDGGGNSPEPRSPVGIQSDVELRQKHNAALPIHALPVELFLQVVHYDLQRFLEHNYRGYYSHVVGLSGVCSYWYNVIRDSPPIWAQIHSSDSPNLVAMAFQRSSGHLIDIEIHEVRDQEHLQQFINSILPHTNRWRSVDAFTARSWMSLLTAALDKPALSLEKLSLADQDTMSSNHEIDLFGGITPKLKDLTLNGVSARWDSEVVHGLKFIDLSWIKFSSAKTVLDILSHSPQLQRAIVWRCTTESISRDSSYSIHLSQLSSLRIDLGSFEAIDNVLASVKGSDRSSLSMRLFSGENMGGFLRSRVAGWTSNWNVTPTFQLGGLQLDIDSSDLRMGILTPSHPEPLAFAIKGFRIQEDEFLVAFSFVVDTLVSWAKESATIHLKLGNSPSFYPFYEAHTPPLFVNELSRLPRITSLEISSIGEGSLADILIREGASSVFQDVCALSFSGLDPSMPSGTLEWISHTVRFIKTATESSLDEVDRKPKLQKVELRFFVPVDSNMAESVEVAVKELEAVVGPGTVFVENGDPY
ncbi:hypothetical protein FRC01_010825 [Tulasnella sp. 417]|nr:hypothetical protein FRC01_010825 [Tulasnella sp. 417]